MKSFTNRLTEAVTALDEQTQPNEHVDMDPAGAPPEIESLLQALEYRSFPRLSLGNYKLDGGPGFRQLHSAVGTVADLNEALEYEGTSVAKLLPDLDPRKCLLFGNYSGMSELFLSWGRGKIEVGVAEREEPMPDTAIVMYDDPAAFKAFLVQFLDPGVHGWNGVKALLEDR